MNLNNEEVPKDTEQDTHTKKSLDENDKTFNDQSDVMQKTEEKNVNVEGEKSKEKIDNDEVRDTIRNTILEDSDKPKEVINTQDNYFNLKDLSKYVNLFTIFNIIGIVLSLCSSIINPIAFPIAIVSAIPVYYLHKLNTNLKNNLEKLTPYDNIPQEVYSKMSYDFKTYFKTYLIATVVAIVLIFVMAMVIGIAFTALM